MNKVFIIAEAGVNHNGDINLAKKLIDKAVEAGVDAIKFQTFKAENLVSKNAKKAKYQVENTKNNESQYEMLKKLELSFKDFEELKKYCDEKGIMFLSTPFDEESIKIFDKKIETMKIYDSEIGQYTFSEIEETIKALAQVRGAQAECKYAKSFMLLKEIV